MATGTGGITDSMTRLGCLSESVSTLMNGLEEKMENNANDIMTIEETSVRFSRTLEVITEHNGKIMKKITTSSALGKKNIDNMRNLEKEIGLIKSG